MDQDKNTKSPDAVTNVNDGTQLSCHQDLPMETDDVVPRKISYAQAALSDLESIAIPGETARLAKRFRVIFSENGIHWKIQPFRLRERKSLTDAARPYLNKSVTNVTKKSRVIWEYADGTDGREIIVLRVVSQSYLFDSSPK